ISMRHPATRRTDRIARTQAEASVVIVRRYIDDALNEGAEGWKEAHDCFNLLYWYLRSNEYVKVSDVQLGIDALTIIKAFADDVCIDQRYRVMQLKKIICNISKMRCGRS